MGGDLRLRAVAQCSTDLPKFPQRLDKRTMTMPCYDPKTQALDALMAPEMEKMFAAAKRETLAESTRAVTKSLGAVEAQLQRDTRRTLCVDFDGVLHSYTSPWAGVDVVPDPPVPGALAFLASAVERFRVAVFSARSHQPGGINAMRAWLGAHGLAPDVVKALEFPTEKPQAIVYIDDRAVCFTGTFPSLDDLAAFRPWNR